MFGQFVLDEFALQETVNFEGEIPLPFEMAADHPLQRAAQQVRKFR